MAIADESLPVGPSGSVVQVEGRSLRLTNLDRVLWPATGTTKRAMIEYYRAVAPAMLPHLRGRPMTLGRWPEGVDRPGWLQAECRGRPDWLAVHETIGKRAQRIAYCLVDDLPSLLFVANLGTVEMHPVVWRVPRVEPTALVFDLDPGPPASLLDCCRIGLRLRDLVAGSGLELLPKVSGSLGLHLLAPLSGGARFDETKRYARGVAALLAREMPGSVVDSSVRARRGGRVFIDWVQNDPSRSLVAPYSLRATQAPLVATPVTWDEIDDALAADDERRLRFGPAEALERLRTLGDVAAALR